MPRCNQSYSENFHLPKIYFNLPKKKINLFLVSLFFLIDFDKKKHELGKFFLWIQSFNNFSNKTKTKKQNSFFLLVWFQCQVLGEDKEFVCNLWISIDYLGFYYEFHYLTSLIIVPGTPF